MRLLRARADSATGQGMVEFALILPLLVLLLVLTLDFGRVFFSWISLQNTARIGANYAAVHPEDWNVGTGYADAMAADTQCTLTGNQDPQFPNGKTVGSDAVVALTCNFTPITPLVSQLIGSPLELHAQAKFPIRTGEFAGPAGGTPAPSPPPTCRNVPNMVNRTVAQARTDWTNAGFTAAGFTAAGQDAEIVTAQATVPTSSPGDCIDYSATVVVLSAPSTACPNGEFRVPNLLGMTVSDARSAWTAAKFTGDFKPNGQNTSSVVAQTTSPSSSPNDCRPASTTMTVTPGDAPTPAPPPPCIVPNFIGTSSSSAQSTWTGAGFTTTVTYKKPGQRPYVIGFQSVVSSSSVPCTTGLQVGP